jgi:hypothetical protein
MSGFYVNGTNINTLFKTGTVSASTNGGFRINNLDVKSTLKATQGEQSNAIQTYFRILNSDLNTIFRDVNFAPPPFAITTTEITISETGSTDQFPPISGFNTLYITAGTGTCMFNTNVTIAKIFIVGGGCGGSASGAPLTSVRAGLGGNVYETTTGTNITLLANTAFTVTIGEGSASPAQGQSTSVTINAISYSALGGIQASQNSTTVEGTRFNSNQLYYGGSGSSTTLPKLGGGGGVGGSSNGGAGGAGGGISTLLTGGAGGAGGTSGSTSGKGGSNNFYGGGGGGGGYNSSSGSGGNGGSGLSNTGSEDGRVGMTRAQTGPSTYAGGAGAGGSGGKNTGGGGGRGGVLSNTLCANGGDGGSGIVIILYTIVQ